MTTRADLRRTSPEDLHKAYNPDDKIYTVMCWVILAFCVGTVIGVVVAALSMPSV